MRCGLLCGLWLTIMGFTCLILVSIGLMVGLFTTAVVAEGNIITVDNLNNQTCRLAYQIIGSNQLMTVELPMSQDACNAYAAVDKLYFYNTRNSMVYGTKRTYPAEGFWMTWVLNQVSVLLIAFI